MKTINIKRIGCSLGLILTILSFGGCKKSFLERPPTDAIVDVNFYKTDEQLSAATALLYNKVWFDFNDNPNFSFGDIRAGITFRGYNERGNVEFNTTDITPENRKAWASLFVVIGQSNLLIANVNRYAGAGTSEKARKTAIAEARFMRAVAYRYLVMSWGEVPIIEDNLKLLTDPTVKKNTVKSIWRFLTREMRAAEEDLPTEASTAGRVTKWSAEGMLARFYLTRAGVEGTGGARSQIFLDSAKYYAKNVIDNSGKALKSNYADLFKYPYDNNEESLFELQWTFLPGDPGYGIGNSAPSNLNWDNSTSGSGGDGWGGDKAATWWMLSLYDGFTASGDTMLSGRTLDQRLKATFMLPGFSYSEISRKDPATGNIIKPFVFPYTNDASRNFANIKKYTIGRGTDVGIENLQQQRYPNNTYIMRLAEMYLIYVEASLGNSASVSDPLAVQYFNRIRNRAGLAPLTDPITGTPLPITLDDILKERFKEFAVEAMAWYDLVSLHYWNPQKAYNILNSQDRGFYWITPDNPNNPTNWVIKKTPWANPPANPRYINASAANFQIPIPAVEIGQAPWLSEQAVDYP